MLLCFVSNSLHYAIYCTLPRLSRNKDKFLLLVECQETLRVKAIMWLSVA